VPEKPLTVLVADDEAVILRTLARVLSKEGFTVHAAADAEAALAILDAHAVDGAVVDHNMPGGGATVLAALIARPGFAGPAVLMTGADVDDPSLPDLPGVTRLQKPFRYETLFELLGGGAP
jgi:CheY-like chemotaxis protein